MDNGASSYRRFLEGDDSGMVELVREYKDGLMLYINSFTNDIYLAEDCVQETFIKLATKTPKFNGRSSFKTWLFTIGRNTALSLLKSRYRHTSETLDEMKCYPAETDLEQECLVEEQKAALYKAIRKIRSDYRQVLILVYIEGFTSDETCKIMNKTKKQVDNLLYNARKALRSELEKEGFQYEKL